MKLIYSMDGCTIQATLVTGANKGPWRLQQKGRVRKTHLMLCFRFYGQMAGFYIVPQEGRVGYRRRLACIRRQWNQLIRCYDIWGEVFFCHLMIWGSSHSFFWLCCCFYFLSELYCFRHEYLSDEFRLTGGSAVEAKLDEGRGVLG